MPTHPPIDDPGNILQADLTHMECVAQLKTIEVSVERPSRAVIWLDTSVIIKIANARRGKLRNHPEELQRVTEIDRVVRAQVAARRLLCIDSEQRFEVWPSGFEHFSDALAMLSLGVDLRPLHEIRLMQTEAAMLAYLQRADSISLPVRAFFDKDPCTVADERLRQRIWISVRLNEHEEVRRHRRQKKRELEAQLEETRQRNVAAGVTFDEQLERETRSTLRAYAALQRRATITALLDPKLKNSESFWHMQGGFALPEVMHIWTGVGGDRKEVGRFYDSRYFRALPREDIQSRLFASLMTQAEKIKSGDADDVDHLALALPIANFVVTDGAMRHRVNKLGLDVKYRARVFSLATTDNLLSELRAL